ncbi:hypothetical protein ASE63_02550 [Bosea sp. Root381]|uniref:SEL1-like repeat protein n=1 Tax=Bosea sp. Root381 TaxID=1736524 RepID=UPI000712DEA6|nr:SEL1-like repeat protein [Bosea sp. Root381]KRE18083.1 hypothetical protein ASE63_02550 [Bosea sp. Root381]
MANSLPWSVKGVDPRTRDAAKAAARRAGMTLGEWLDHKLGEESAPEQLDIAALSDRLARLAQSQMETAPQHPVGPGGSTSLPSRSEIDAVLAQAASIEKLTRESSARTAGALESITRWIEKAEGRMSSGERAAAERQERATSVIADAIKTMGDRLAEIERGSGEALAVRAARQEQAPRLAFSRDGLAAAVTDIRTRQRTLDGDDATPARQQPMSESRIAALRDDLRELSARIAPQAPRGQRPAAPTPAPVPASTAFEAQFGQIEAMLAELGGRIDQRDRFDPVLKPLARIETEVSRLARDRSDEGYQRIELEISHLAAKVDALAARGSDRTMLAPVLRDIGELRDMLASGGEEARLSELSQQVSGLSFEINRLRDNQPDGHELRSLAVSVDEIRDAFRQGSGPARLQDLEPLAALSLQIEGLAGKLDTFPDNQIESRIDSLQHRIEALTETGAAGLTQQIEALAGRVESLAVANSVVHKLGEGQALTVAQVDLGPVEAMLRKLADKIDEAGRPGADSGAFDALEQQISGLAQRLDEAAATRSAESGMERTLQDLVVHLRSMREETTEAAARAARTAMSDHLGRVAPPQSGLAELSTLVSGLHQSHVSSGRETQDAIGAVHRTLETIISRLSSLEAELVADRQPAAPAARMPMPPRIADAGQLAVKAPAMPAAMSLDKEDRIAASGRSTAAPKAEPAITPPLAAALDLPLEPGSGRPRPDSALAGGHDPQSVRQNLIAAARRSARAAAEAAAAPAAEPEAAKGGNRLKEILEKRKRPLLLGLAALVLALGTAHLVNGTLKKSRSANVGEAVQSPIAPQQQAPAETPAEKPANDQSSALPPGPVNPASPTPAAALPQPGAESATAQPQPPASAAAEAPLPEPVQAVTGLGELPAGLGSPGLRKAALEGNARAVYELASRSADGQGAPRDPKLALRLFERAAVAGLAPAQFRLGNMFEKGIGTERDLSLARVWYMRAAERGNAKAMHNLAVLHAEGVSGKPDYATASEWFRRAAEFGVRDSQYNLAVLLERGLGGPPDLAQSYLWFTVGASQGDEDAARKRDEVGQRLGTTDLAAAKAEAANWRPKTLDLAANEVTPPAKGWDETPTAAAAKKPARPARS